MKCYCISSVFAFDICVNKYFNYERVFIRKICARFLCARYGD